MKIVKAGTNPEPAQYELNNRALARKAASEGYVLLENDGILPLKEKKVALYGSGARMTVKGGTGSGQVRERYSVSIAQGLENTGFEITTTAWLDRFDRFYEDTYEAYRLDDVERENLEFVSKHYKNFIVVINAGGVVDVSFLDKLPVSALVYYVQGGEEGGKNGENQKGLVTFDRKLKKDAFYLYKAHWSKEPFVHLCGSRYVDRAEENTEIKVYSNQSKVTLLVDGEEIATKMDGKIYTFQIPLTGEHTVTAKSGDLTDTMTIRKVEKANPDYRMLGGEVVNWFDADKHDPTCFSIKDTMGTLMQHPKAGAIVGRMMAAARASPGSV